VARRNAGVLDFYISFIINFLSTISNKQYQKLRKSISLFHLHFSMQVHNARDDQLLNIKHSKET